MAFEFVKNRLRPLWTVWKRPATASHLCFGCVSDACLWQGAIERQYPALSHGMGTGARECRYEPTCAYDELGDFWDAAGVAFGRACNPRSSTVGLVGCDLFEVGDSPSATPMIPKGSQRIARGRCPSDPGFRHAAPSTPEGVPQSGIALNRAEIQFRPPGTVFCEATCSHRPPHEVRTSDLLSTGTTPATS